MPTGIGRSNNQKKGKLWGIIVGVNQYNYGQNEKLSNLNYCVNDALGLANALKQVATQKLETEAIFNDVEILVHSDIAPSRYSWSSIIAPQKDNILASLDRLSQARPEDSVLFYFGGHGYYDQDTGNTILCLSQTQKNNLSQTGLLITEVLNKIITSAAKQQFIFLDACHSGGIASQLIDAILRVTKDNPRLYCITACDRHQKSLECAELGHGVFTYYLIEGLKGGLSNSVTKIKADELYKYVYYKTLEYIKHTNQRLNFNKKYSLYPTFKPQRFVKGSGDFILGVSSPVTMEKGRGALVINGNIPSPVTIDLMQSFSAKGGFTYQPYPSNEESLKDSISALLDSQTTTTALLYLKGKFETNNDERVWFVFDDGIRITRDWLGKQLAKSPIPKQIIILECSQTANINNHIESLKQPEKSQCIIATSTDGNWLGSQFLKIIRKHSKDGLTGTNLILQFKTAFWERGILNPQQQEFYRSDKGIINVILPQAQQPEGMIVNVDPNYCPYKALEAFTTEDKDFFFGRDDLIQEIIDKLQDKTFVMVVGASGSGKSSLVQAGVVPRLLEEGIFDPEDNHEKACQVWSLRPGEHPIRQLAKAFNDPNLSLAFNQLDTALSKGNHSPDYLKGILHQGIESLVVWLAQQTQPVGILVIDQFEELLTLTSDVERGLFLELIFGAVENAADCFKVIVTLRSDFTTYCLENAELGEKVRQNSIFVPSYLHEKEYRQIMTAPAKRVGLTVETQLVNVLVEEVSAEKAALPLLEFTLEQLWQNRVGGKLSLEVYQQRIGGIRQVLQDRADSVYQKLTSSQQKCAEWIFTRLVRLGEGTEDTRRRRNLSELIVPKYTPELIKSTLNLLRDSRLIVMSNQDGYLINNRQTEAQTRGDSKAPEPVQLSLNWEVTVEIAHEILIRNWQHLRYWLDKNREHIRLREKIEQRAKEIDDLLGGTTLLQAEEFYMKYADELNNKSKEFIRQSIEERDRQAQLAKLRRRQLFGGLTVGIVAISIVGGAALWQLRRATISEINALSNSAEKLLALNQGLDALVTALKAGKKIKNSWFRVGDRTEIKVLAGLQNILYYQVKEVNRLESHTGWINHLAFNPDGTTIASASDDGTIKLWNLQGELICTLSGHTQSVNHLAFNPDGTTIASASDDSTIKLWNLQGELLHTLSDHNGWVNHLAFSTDGTTIASAGSIDRTIKLWDIQGESLHTLSGHTGWINHLAFSTDGTTIISASDDGTIKRWNLQGELLHTLQDLSGSVYQLEFNPDGTSKVSPISDRTIGRWSFQGELLHTLKVYTGLVSILGSSPNGKTLASASYDGTIGLWNLQGESLHTLKGHTERVNQLAFSPDGKTIASASYDGTIKLWSLDLDNVLTRGCDWVKDYLNHNPNISGEERNICDGYFSNSTQ